MLQRFLKELASEPKERLLMNKISAAYKLLKRFDFYNSFIILQAGQSNFPIQYPNYNHRQT